MAKEKFDFKKYNEEYKKKHYKRIMITIPLKDVEVINQLNNVASKSNYIYQLIKDDIKDKKIIANVEKKAYK